MFGNHQSAKRLGFGGWALVPRVTNSIFVLVRDYYRVECLMRVWLLTPKKTKQTWGGCGLIYHVVDE